MATRGIDRSQWKEFCNQFSRSHRGWLVSVEAFGSEFGAQVGARSLPFEGITAEQTGDGGWRIELMAGYKPTDHVSHRIDQPVKLWLSTLDETDSEVLEIESADQQRILVRFSSAKDARR
jgi:hypothetical protein